MSALPALESRMCSTTKPPLGHPKKYFGNLDEKAENNVKWEINLYVRAVVLFKTRINVEEVQ